MTHNRGFTLIELSIVLVIIGLLVGGVLVGRDLIAAATLRSIVSDIEKFNTAAMAFQNKYNCLPGDCDHATTIFAAAGNCNTGQHLDGTTCDGDGNNVINFTDGASKSESVHFWQHLALANMIPGSYSGYITYNDGTTTHYQQNVYPKSKLRNVYYQVSPYPNGGIGGSFVTSSGNYYMLRGNYDSNGNPYFVMSAQESFYIDTKLDDGKAGLGGIVAEGSTSHQGLPCATTDTATTAEYDIAGNHGYVCNLYVKMPF